MLLDLSPLRKNRDYRLLYFGQVISFLGSMVSYVAVPYQVYEITKNNALVGLIGIAQLVPVLIFGILGGTYADRLNRRRLLLFSEVALSLSVLGLALNSMRPDPSVPLIFVMVAVSQAVTGFHRPAMEALTQELIAKEDYASIGALGSFRYSFCAIAGPALGGTIIAVFGAQGAYWFDFVTFGAAVACLALMKPSAVLTPTANTPWADMREGMRFALSKPQLIGTYVVDIVAMIFAFPIALFPAMSTQWGGAQAAGVLFSAMAVGSLVMTVVSGWTKEVRHQGRGVVFSASFWALFMIGVAYAPSLWGAFAFLALAGGADMVSGIFRGVIWNESIPNTLRGRLAGIEMISYMTGPLLGNARAGWIAQKYSVHASLVSGGAICFFAVVITAALLPAFWRYRGGAPSRA